MSDPIKVGKRPGIGVYVHVTAIDGGRSNLKEWEIAAFREAHRALFAKDPFFGFDFVHINGDGSRVRFLKMSSLWEAHPHVVESRVVDSSGEKVQITDGKIGGQIYHRLETMIDPEHPSWEFHNQVTRWEESEGFFSASAPQSSFGSKRAWQAWIEKKMPYSDYEKRISLLFQKFTDNVFPNMHKNTLGDGV